MMKLGTTALTVIAALALASAGVSEEATPSQKTKDAVDKFNQAPSALEQKFDDLKSLWDRWSQAMAEPLWPQQSSAPPRGASQK